MDNGLLFLHNIMRWVILVLLLLSIFRAFSGWKNRRAFTPADRKTWLFAMIAGHITLLIGLYQLLLGRYGLLTVDAPEGGVMKDKFYRFFWVEHPTFMILAIVMMTLGYGTAKKNLADDQKFRRAMWLFIVALLFVLVAIPWPFRAGIGRPWFPIMQD